MKKIVIGAISSLTLIGATGVCASAYLYKTAMRAKNTLSHFVILPDENKTIDISKIQKINYVALGDSLTSGYNDILGEDFHSFADYIKSNLKKAGRLKNYHNLAKMGHMIFDTQKMITQQLTVTRKTMEADLITVSIGANDLLKYAKIFDLPFSTIASQEMMEIKDNEYRKKHAPSSFRTTEPWEIYDVTAKSIDMLQESIKTDDYSGSIHLQPDHENTILGLIERNMQILIHDMHSVAPNARIIIVSHPNPFVNFNSSLLEKPIIQNKYKNLNYFYEKYKKALAASAEGRDFVDYIDLDSMKALTDDKATLTFPDEQIIRRRAFPNTVAIHPSLYGHEIIGNRMFETIISKLLKIGDPQKFLTKAKDKVDRSDSVNNFNPVFLDENEEYSQNFLVDKLLRKIVNSFSKNPLENNLMFKIFSSLNEIYELYCKTAYRSNKLIVSDESALIKSNYGTVKSYEINQIGEMVTRIMNDDKEKLDYGLQKIIARLMLLMYPLLTDPETNKKIANMFKEFKDQKLLTLKQVEELRALFSAIPESIVNSDPNSDKFIYNSSLETKSTFFYNASNIEELNDKYRISYFLNATLKQGFDADRRVYWKAIKSFFDFKKTGAYFNPLCLTLEGGIDNLINLINRYGVKISGVDFKKMKRDWKEKEKDLYEKEDPIIKNVNTIKKILEFIRNNFNMRGSSERPKLVVEKLKASDEFTDDQMEIYEQYIELVKHNESFNSKYADEKFIKNLIIVSYLSKEKDNNNEFVKFLNKFSRLLDINENKDKSENALTSLFDMLKLKEK